MITLVTPNDAFLPAYAASLQAGWSPNTTRDVTAEQLAEIADDPGRFLRVLRGEEKGVVTLPDGRSVERLPGEVRWIWDGTFCGAINLRYLPGLEALPDYVSGHIGFSIIPEKRRRGLASRALGLMLEVAGGRGLRRVSLTCDLHNHGSRRVILSNGGVPAPSPSTGKLLFWITLPEKIAMPTLPDTIQQTISAWSGIAPPNDPGRRLAADLAATIAAFEALRGTMQFEDEPSSFTTALQAAKE